MRSKKADLFFWPEMFLQRGGDQAAVFCGFVLLYPIDFRGQGGSSAGVVFRVGAVGHDRVQFAVMPWHRDIQDAAPDGCLRAAAAAMGLEDHGVVVVLEPTGIHHDESLVIEIGGHNLAGTIALALFDLFEIDSMENGGIVHGGIFPARRLCVKSFHGRVTLMIYRRFGKTGIQMPVISAGFMRAMHTWGQISLSQVPAASQQNLERVVQQALALGIIHLETARAYGSCERQLGVVLEKLPRDGFILQTKVQPTADPDEFVNEVRDSLTRLRVSRLDLLAIHGINNHRALWYTCRKGGCLAAARRLQDQGLVGHIGFSGHGPTEILCEAVRHEEDGGFDYMNLHWYYIFQAHTPAIELAAAKDMGVFIISPTDKGGRLQEPSELLRELSRPLSPMQFNDLFCLAHPGVSTISVGAARIEDFDEHLAVLLHLDRAKEILPAIDRQWRDKMAAATGNERPDVWFERFCGWEENPGYINLPFILWLYDLARGWGLADYARSRYQLLGREMPWVAGADAAGIDRYDFREFFAGSSLDPQEILGLARAAHVLLGENRIAR